ncbi:MAG: SRPBCC family protein [Bacteroidia bacterium]|nr:SRPBCC family protein [Bacteroidia bacterium]
MISITASEVIARPIREVFAYAGDYRNDTAWRKGVVEMRYEGRDEPAKGVVTFEVMRSMGMKNTTVAEITEYNPVARTAFRSISGPVPCHGFREFQESAEGTTFTYVLTLEPRGVMRLLKPMLRTMFQKQVGEDVRRLKAKLEHTNLQASS